MLDKLEANKSRSFPISLKRDLSEELRLRPISDTVKSQMPKKGFPTATLEGRSQLFTGSDFRRVVPFAQRISMD
jgi:hypothetical protein